MPRSQNSGSDEGVPNDPSPMPANGGPKWRKWTGQSTKIYGILPILRTHSHTYRYPKSSPKPNTSDTKAMERKKEAILGWQGATHGEALLVHVKYEKSRTSQLTQSPYPAMITVFGSSPYFVTAWWSSLESDFVALTSFLKRIRPNKEPALTKRSPDHLEGLRIANSFLGYVVGRLGRKGYKMRE